ncbi:hypothetical protein D3C85_677720 [compost metagenome]
MLASQPLGKARLLLQDVGADRWTDSDLLGWLTSGVSQVIALRPDASSRRQTITLVAGVEQSIPADAIALLDVLNNINDDDTVGRGVTLTNRDSLDQIDLNWRAAAPRATRQYMVDATTPRTFDVTPPAVLGAKLRIAVSFTPAPITTMGQTVPIPDSFEGPLIDYVCFRARMQDSDDPADQAGAANHLAAFTQALTGKTQTDTAVQPKRK